MRILHCPPHRLPRYPHCWEDLKGEVFQGQKETNASHASPQPGNSRAVFTGDFSKQCLTVPISLRVLDG